MSKPVLNIFRISHYCEKARWALDYLDIDYELRTLPVIAHIEIVNQRIRYMRRLWRSRGKWGHLGHNDLQTASSLLAAKKSLVSLFFVLE